MELWNFKGALSGLKQFLATESHLKIMRKALFVLKIFKCLYWLFDHAEKQLDERDKIDFKIYDVTTLEMDNCNTHIS